MQVSLKCAVAWLLAGLLMLGGIPALALEDYSDAWDAGQSGGGASGASVNHIDIGVNVSVELVVDGVGKTETLTLTRADIQAADAFSITAAYGTGAADGAGPLSGACACGTVSVFCMFFRFVHGADIQKFL